MNEDLGDMEVVGVKERRGEEEEKKNEENERQQA